MKSFVENDFPRESIFSSSSSKDSINSQLSNVLSGFNSFGYRIDNNRKEILTNEKEICSSKFLFFGPLILFLILFLTGILVFLLVHYRTPNHQIKQIFSADQFPNENFLPVFCSFPSSKKINQPEFALNEEKCGINRSSIFTIYYKNSRLLTKPGENLSLDEVFSPPKIELNYRFLSRINTKSFLLILIDRNALPNVADVIILHWIRYYSSSLEIEEDICSYKSMDYMVIHGQSKVILLYATNSTQMIIRTKTFCRLALDWFQLDQYILFIKLKLIASTYFFLPYTEKYFNE